MSLPFDLNASSTQDTKPTLKDVWQAQLERWYAHPGLYRWSLASPLTRWLTRRRTRKLFDLMAGFVHSQVLLACVRLDLFCILHRAPASLAELANRTSLAPNVLQRLLLSAVALDLLEHRSQDRFGLGPLGVPLAQHEGIAQMIEHNHLLYQDMQDPLQFLRNAWSGGMAQYWPYAHEKNAAAMPEAKVEVDQFSRYSQLMAASQGFVVQEILSSYFFDEHRCVLDVGAGKGRFVSELAAHVPHLQFKMFDLPPVLALAREGLHAKGLSDRVSLHPGSFLHDPLPQGADLITLVRVAHDHPDAVVLQLLQKAYDALPLGGGILLAEPMAQSQQGAVQGDTSVDAYFHFYLLAMGDGRLRTPHELMSMMKAVGFTHVELVPNAMPIHAQILLGRKSKCLPSNPEISVN
uniref:Hydroxyneurosporene methyltransferase n=1 Tax=uncultured proteobacterium DelRiverFos06H03 TaxID=311783 RepID=Q58PM4_9PROT|nr:hydroxyneurosporene methyltransferase [uncultured proteobacterium DelRiverFos06H03]